MRDSARQGNGARRRKRNRRQLRRAGTGAGGEVEPGEERIDPELIKLAAMLLVGAIAALLDTTIVNVAIHTIGRDLNAPLARCSG